MSVVMATAKPIKNCRQFNVVKEGENRYLVYNADLPGEGYYGKLISRHYKQEAAEQAASRLEREYYERITHVVNESAANTTRGLGEYNLWLMARLPDDMSSNDHGQLLHRGTIVKFWKEYHNKGAVSLHFVRSILETTIGRYEMPLTKDLLNFIIMIQAYKKYVMAQKTYENSSDNWLAKTQDFFNSTPIEKLTDLGLSKNWLSFDAVLNFKVSDQMLQTEYSQLPTRFVFKI